MKHLLRFSGNEWSRETVASCHRNFETPHKIKVRQSVTLNEKCLFGKCQNTKRAHCPWTNCWHKTYSLHFYKLMIVNASDLLPFSDYKFCESKQILISHHGSDGRRWYKSGLSKIMEPWHLRSSVYGKRSNVKASTENTWRKTALYGLFHLISVDFTRQKARVLQHKQIVITHQLSWHLPAFQSSHSKSFCQVQRPRRELWLKNSIMPSTSMAGSTWRILELPLMKSIRCLLWYAIQFLTLPVLSYWCASMRFGLIDNLV